MSPQKSRFSAVFNVLGRRALWRNATLLWRCSWVGAVLALSSVSAQTLAPFGVTASQNVTTAGQTLARLGPSGSVYLGGSSGTLIRPVATTSYGDTSKSVFYVSRVDSTGKTVFTTALGGVALAGMYIDTSGNVFLSGSASNAGFYVSPGAYRTTAPSSNSGFVCKLSGTDGSVQYCTYMDYAGGANGGGVDQAGEFIAVVGAFAFNGALPPTTTGAVHLGKGNIYVAKLNPAGSALEYVAEFGGTGVDLPLNEAVDASGNVYIAGQTTSGDFPTTPGAAYGGTNTAGSAPESSFLTKVSADGSSLVYSTLGLVGEEPVGLTLDSVGDAQMLYRNPATQVGLRRYNASGTAILFDAFTGINVASSSVLGEPLMAVDGGGDTAVFFLVNFITPPLVNPTQTCQFTLATPAYQGGFTDSGFMVRLDPSGKVQQSTYLQGTGTPLFEDVSVQLSGSMTLAAWSGSPSQLQLLTIAPAAAISLACIGSSASLVDAPLAAGEIVSLFGVGIGPAQPIVGLPRPDCPGPCGIEGNPTPQTPYVYPTALGATSVTFDGVLAPLLYVSSTQINAVVPFAAKNTTHVCVTYFFNPPSCMDAPIVFAAPAIFTIPQSNPGVLYAAAVNQDGTINSQASPAPRGSIISLFATGLGALSSMPTDGDTVVLPLLTQSLTVMVGSSNSPYQEPPPALTAPEWSGQAPFEIAGLSQVNAVVPGSGNIIWLQVTQPGTGGATVSSQSVQIWVK